MTEYEINDIEQKLKALSSPIGGYERGLAYDLLAEVRRPRDVIADAYQLAGAITHKFDIPAEDCVPLLDLLGFEGCEPEKEEP